MQTTAVVHRKSGSGRAYTPTAFSPIYVAKDFPNIGFPQPPLSNTCSFQSIYRTYLYRHYRGFWCHFWSVLSLLCSSGRFMYALSYMWDWVKYQQNSFHQIVLCLNMAKINPSVSDSQSLNRHRLLSCVDPQCHLISQGHISETPTDVARHGALIMRHCYIKASILV